MTFPDCSDRRAASSRPVPRRLRRALPALVAALVAPWLASLAFAIEPFVVRDIRVEGVQRTEAGTIFSYLPIKSGDRVDDQKISDAVKALYATGFFRDVRLERQGDVLVVIVQERPTISSLTFVGNKEFDTETVKKALREIGVSESRIFDRSALDRAEQELKRQYVSRGLYGASVQTTVTPQERNRVAINFTITEGDPAKIARVNIIGNKSYTLTQLRDEMKLTTPGWLTWYTKDDQYSKQKLSADLESLRSFYQNRGYLEFSIDSTQVSITPDKDDIYITINITEGEKYTVSGVELAGDLVVPHDELVRLVQLKAGDTFSRAKQQATTKSISDRLGAEGYAFANVSAVPEVDKQKHTVAYTLYVDPGRRVYVRRINIIGNARTRDEVIRREARQLEGAWFDSQRIDRSKVRIKRLGYFDDVNVETQPVAGSNDQVDLEFSVTERTTGNLLAGVGYSTSDGVVFSASVSQQNVLGTGNALAVGINTSKINRTISAVYTDPYWTVDGVSRTVELYQKNIDPTSLAVSNYESSTLGAAMSFGVPISESDTINLGGRIEHTDITLFSESPPAYIQYVNEFGAVTNSYILTAGWSRDTRDDILYPNEGRLQSFSLEVGLPITNTAYYKAEYVNQWFWPIWSPAILMLRGNVGYADGYSGDPLPFFKAFYAGGVGSVRGYEQSSLGPRDVFGNSLGGKRKIVGNAELFYPLVKGDRAVRASVFADLGQIYANGDQPDFESFRFSAGVGVAWNSPIGPLKFSYAIPLQSKPGDRLQRFQFQVGTVF
jgi:outer membrane protein insertion porin family